MVQKDGFFQIIRETEKDKYVIAGYATDLIEAMEFAEQYIRRANAAPPDPARVYILDPQKNCKLSLPFLKRWLENRKKYQNTRR